ncbi:MAG: polyprenyl synthetase family protein [Actinomycetaceae bacterium]|nr:polyprenyl synthetase family protein [Actinomycetaceae bacterium]
MDSSDFRSAVSTRLDTWFSSLGFLVENPYEREAFDELETQIRSIVRGGKRTRALLAYAGMLCAGDINEEQAVALGAALELFQASALVHDDIIDNSPLRRGKPSAHIAFEQLHAEKSWLGDGNSFGRGAAITIGDLLLAGACELFNQALESAPSDAVLTALSLFNTMMIEVAYGQFLDIREEHLPLNETAPHERALGILTHKSARYSVEMPLTIGATLAGAHPQLVNDLRDLGLQLGIAFQLRDDDLGIFGDPAVTGKPACGDIAEGKRTVLLSLMRERITADDRAFLDECLGRELSAGEAERIQRLGEECGARAAHETMIESYEGEAHSRAQSLQCHESGRALLGEIMTELSQRLA